MILDGKEEGLDYFVSVRVEKTAKGNVYVYGGAAEWLFQPPYSREIAKQVVREKLSLLVLAPVGVPIKGIGRKLGANPEVYYVRMFPKDVRRLQPDCYRKEDI